MTRFGRLMGRNGQGVSLGGHRLGDRDVLAATHAGAINPLNPGEMAHARTMAVLPRPRYFKPGEDQALQELAYRKKAEMAASRRAYSSLKTIERMDAELTSTHRQYEAVVAQAELHKKAADVQYARELHHQRGDYAMLAAATRGARQGATDMIGRYMQAAHQLAAA
jgi:hypothetical protein